MGMKKSTMFVLCLFTLGLITACQPVESITIDEISGVWRSESGGHFMSLNEDGTFFQSASTIPENAFVFGQWQLEGTTLTIHADDESLFCAGYSATSQVEFIEEDKFKNILIKVLIKDYCPEGGIKGEEIWLRWSP